jgi:GH25 family lysozyme M1 (1,4-beta-N-acetylmuramidase)
LLSPKTLLGDRVIPSPRIEVRRSTTFTNSAEHGPALGHGRAVAHGSELTRGDILGSHAMRSTSNWRRRGSRWLALASVAVALVAATVNAAPGNAAIRRLVGPDVSRYQHPNGTAINWDAVFGAGGQSFAIVKATENADFTSPTFRRDWSTLAARGFIRGAYHYARPSGAPGDAVAEARHYVSVAGTMSRPGQLPPILDVEETGGLAPAALASWLRSWLTEMQRLTGRKPMIYTSPGWWDGNVRSTAFGGYPLQVAHYTANAAPRLPRGWSTWTFWQYTSSARVAGIPAATDHNRFNGDLTKLRGLARLAGGA